MNVMFRKYIQSVTRNLLCSEYTVIQLTLVSHAWLAGGSKGRPVLGDIWRIHTIVVSWRGGRRRGDVLIVLLGDCVFVRGPGQHVHVTEYTVIKVWVHNPV